MRIYDSDIRKILYKSFGKRKSYTVTPTIVVDEMDVCAGRSRVDIAVINGSIHGYEIKSKQDSLARLPGQVVDYNKVFDTMTIVGFESHIQKIIDLVPTWWEVKSVKEEDGKINMATVRRGKRNKDIDLTSLVSLLWRDEMINMISSYTDIVKGYKSKTRKQLGQIIIKNINPKFVINLVRETLKLRTAWRAVPVQQLCDDCRRMLPN